METSASSKKKKTPKKQESTTVVAGVRPVLYEKVSVKLCVGDKAITAKDAKKLLGWEELPTEDGESEYLFEVKNGDTKQRIRCTQNLDNRPYRKSLVDTYRQEILRKRWQLNGEPIIVGTTGKILDGQHRLISLVLATMEYESSPEKFPEWNVAPTIDQLCCFGISEDDLVVNTINTGVPRSLSDVIYRSEYFAGMKSDAKKTISRSLEYAVRLVWYRTGAADAFAPRRTHSESLDFIRKHETLLEFARYIYELDVDKRLSKLISLGYATGLCYLMAVGASDGAEYEKCFDESALNFDRKTDAKFFWERMASEGGLDIVKNVLKQLGPEASQHELYAVIVKAWNVFVREKEVSSAKALKLKYHTDEDGVTQLAECPTCGGIDLGNPADGREKVVKPAAKPESETQTPEEEQHESSEQVSSDGRFVIGREYLVRGDEDGTDWQGELVSIDGEVTKIRASSGYAGAGRLFKVPMSRLQEIE